MPRLKATLTRLVLFLCSASLLAQTSGPAAATVEVTATRFPEDPAKVPASISVLTAAELAERGVVDLRGALSLLAGVYIAPGGDAGPAASVPEFWGLKEFDAFLLVVDGVPWGGAFNPALATLSLEGVERIEVQRGAAPVLYGATSFVGVIQIIRAVPAGDGQGSARLSLGSHGSGGAALALHLPGWAGVDSSLFLDHEKQGFNDARTDFRRDHLLWRNRVQGLDGVFRFDIEGSVVDQSPASPLPRVGRALTDQVPLDANHNPAGAFIKDRRFTLTSGYDRKAGGALWSTTLSASRASQDVFRGFLVDVSTTDPNAHGFRERLDFTDVYFDSHLTWDLGGGSKVVTGLDHLHGQGIGKGGDFDYSVALDGLNPPGSASLPAQAAIRVDDQRDFSGLYGFAQWQAAPRLVFEAGLRLTRARETRQTATLDFDSQTLDTGQDARTTTRLSGSAGGTWTAWQRGEDRVNVFAGVRNTFKPAAVDLGLDSAAEILKPETATSCDLGLKADLAGRRLSLELSTFLMDFQNLVVPQTVDGLPSLANAGSERFQGAEFSAVWRCGGAVTTRLAYSYHDARFRDYAKDFGDGTLTQLAGKKLEMSPYHLGALGLIYAPARGFTADAELNYVGAVLLNQRNTAPSGGYSTFAAGFGWREKRWELRLAGQNLSDQRRPVSESELGDAQYYLLPGRQLNASVRCRF